MRSVMSARKMNSDGDFSSVQPQKITRYQSGVQKCIINLYFSLRKEASEEEVYMTHSDIVNRVAKLLMLSSSRVDEIIKASPTGEFSTPGKSRKRKCPVTDVDSFTEEGIANKIYRKLSQGQSVTIRGLFQEVKLDETLGFEGSESSLRRLIKKMGFIWGLGDKYAHVRESEDVIFKRSCFLRNYMRMKHEENPRPFVFLDETWIYTNGESTKTWLKKGELRGHPRRPEEGNRLVILHAGSRDGFIPGASLIFNTKLKTGQDYHGAMNSDTFQRWVESQFIPGLRTLGPCIVVMDNASYHSKVADPQPTTKWKKNELLAWLNERSIVVPANPTVVELRGICKLHKSHFKRYVIDDILKANGHEVLRLPPYHCIFNAIEEVWSETKHFYSSNVTAWPGNGFERAKTVWQEALNKVTKEKWGRYVDHVEKVMVDYWNKEVVNVPEVQDLEIQLNDDDDDDDDKDEPLAFPLE